MWAALSERAISPSESEDCLKGTSLLAPDAKISIVRILVVEDDPRMRELVRRGLAEESHAVDSAGSMPTALEHAQTTPYDVMVVDVMLPGASGLDLVRALRRAGNQTPVLMLTARDAATDVVAGLDAGADDYLTKPFALKVLL